MMVLFVDSGDIWSHRMRIAVAEKGLPASIHEIDANDPPSELAELNPYMSVPTLIDRDLALYDSRVIIDYLDERFQHPALLPPNPVVRAQLRLALYRLERDWYGLLDGLDVGEEHAKRLLTTSLVASAPIFAAKHYFMSDEFTLVDATIVPILARLHHWGITLPEEAAPVLAYAKRVFDRPSVALTLPSMLTNPSDVCLAP